jgi:Cytotoxic translational repressor of toxin-antitoxin stability system
MKILPTAVRKRINSRLQLLGEEPRGTGTKKLKGDSTFSARVGSYRILYEINDRERHVVVTGVRHRREAYR